MRAWRLSGAAPVRSWAYRRSCLPAWQANACLPSIRPSVQAPPPPLLRSRRLLRLDLELVAAERHVGRIAPIVLHLGVACVGLALDDVPLGFVGQGAVGLWKPSAQMAVKFGTCGAMVDR